EVVAVSNIWEWTPADRIPTAGQVLAHTIRQALADGRTVIISGEAVNPEQQTLDSEGPEFARMVERLWIPYREFWSTMQPAPGTPPFAIHILRPEMVPASLRTPPAPLPER